jgi:PhnB protein
LINNARSFEMTQTPVKHIPEGMRSLTPHIVCDGAAEAIEFYNKAFGAVEEFRLPAPGGKLMLAQVRIGDSALMLVDQFPEMGVKNPKELGGSPVTLHLFVKDVDATVAQAVAAGAKVTMPVADMFWGDRYGVLQDPFGHQWSVATHVRDLTPDEIARNMSSMAR